MASGNDHTEPSVPELLFGSMETTPSPVMSLPTRSSPLLASTSIAQAPCWLEVEASARLTAARSHEEVAAAAPYRTMMTENNTSFVAQQQRWRTADPRTNGEPSKMAVDLQTSKNKQIQMWRYFKPIQASKLAEERSASVPCLTVKVTSNG